MADTSLYAAREIISKGKREELLTFFGQTNNMGLINKSNKCLLEYQRLVLEHTSFWSSLYKRKIPDITFDAPFSWEKRRHWKIQKGAESSSAFQWKV